MFWRKKGKTATFSRRTILLLMPIPATVGLINISSRSLMNTFNASITNWNSIDNSIADLSQIINMRPMPKEIKNYGDILEFENSNKKYKIEQLRPFNPLLFGPNFGYRKGVIEDSSLKLSSQNKIQEKNIKFVKSESKYLLKKEHFEATDIKDRGNLSLVIDVKFTSDDGKQLPITSSIDLSHMLFSKEGSFPIASIVEIQENPKTPDVYSIKFSKEEYKEQLEISLEKSSENGPFKEMTISDFYIVFSDNPSVSFYGLFKNQNEEINSAFDMEPARIKKVFLNRWTKQTNNTEEGANFEFLTSNGFWSSSCVDPYKIGGFIRNSTTTPKVNKPQNNINSSNNNNNTFRKQQIDSFVEFSPFDQIDENKRNKTIEPYTDAIPCSGMEQQTKDKLKTMKETMNWSLAPEAIKNIVEDKDQDSKSKVIQSAIKKNTKNGLKISTFEEANQTTHSFNIKIKKETLEKQLLEHEKLKTINQIPEVSSQLQVHVPYLLTIYDPTNNYVNHQKINLNVALDMKSIYNQSQYTTNFLSYDIEENNKKSSGISGKINFEAGLELDTDGNLNVQLIVKTQGFFKKINQDNCDPRKWDSSDCQDKDKISAFIVLKITDDPSISSFLVDGRITGKNYENNEEKDATSTLSQFKNKIQNPQISFVQQLDKTNNAEVFFDRIDVADPVSQKLEYIKHNSEIPNIPNSRNYFISSYYVPRRNYGEIQVKNDSLLKDLVIYASGSATLGGSFFTSMHYGTKITFCTSTKEKSDSSMTEECADGKKYEKIEKDKPNSSVDSEVFKSININFQNLKSANKDNPKVFDFQTVINKPPEANEWDKSKTNLEYIMKENDGFSPNSSDSSKAPTFAFVAVWYQLSVWWDESNKKICYYTKLTPISAIANLNEKSPKGVKNKESVKSVGSSAKAGFQISKIEFKYGKNS